MKADGPANTDKDNGVNDGMNGSGVPGQAGFDV